MAIATGQQALAADVNASRQIAVGTYSGNNGDDRQITVGFACKIVIITCNATGKTWILISQTEANNAYHTEASPYHQVCAGTNLHATDGFVVSTTTDVANNTGNTYYYWAQSA